MRSLFFLIFLPVITIAQAPQLTVGAVYPTRGPDMRSRVEYSIVPSKSVSEAWIEVWDRPKLLSRSRVEVREHGQILMPDYEEPESPDTLRIAIYDPQVPVYCIDFCDEGVGVMRGDTVSETVIGVSDPKYWPTPDLDGALAQRVAAGTEGLELVVFGHGFSSKTRVLLVDQKFKDPHPGQGGSSFAHTVLAALNTQFVDSCTLHVNVPSGDVLQPAHLQLYVTNEIAEDSTALSKSGTSLGDRAESLYVVRSDSPIIDKIGPVAGGKSAKEWLVTVWGKNFTPHLMAHLGRDPDSFASWRIDTEVVSPTELRLRFNDDPRHASERLLWLADDDDETRVSEPVELNRTPTAALDPNPAPALVCSVDPYPFEMLQPNSPKFVRLRVRGHHFRPDDVVVVKRTYSHDDVKLKTTFVSPEELSARFSRDLWRMHKISFRLVVQTGSKNYDVEVSDTD